MATSPPQPSPSRMVEPAGRPLVVGIVPGQPELVALTAQAWARAVGAPALYFAYADTSRVVVTEHEDGTVDHQPVDPDGADDEWREVGAQIERMLTEVVHDVPWQFRFLAGRPDRALTHLARAVDASALVVGTRAPGAGARLRSWVEGSVAVRLSHHQHRPVLLVPLQVVDWKERSPWA
ncbi:MAG: universal stress protein [Cellulomonas sp.]|nr:universal stress protein [Cellulomonas sp.]